MRLMFFVATLALATPLVGSSTVVAQTASSPLTIHNVRLHELSGELTITGTGFGTAPVVAVDGQPVTGAARRHRHAARGAGAAAALTTPGTYRLSVVDPARQLGDGFVIAITAETVAAVAASGGAGTGGTSSTGTPGDSTSRTSSRALAADTAGTCGVSPNLIEGATNTSVGNSALMVVTTGNYDTGLGAGALFSNTAGSANTASGYVALFYNTTGNNNTATGMQSLVSNTTGHNNTASGRDALYYSTSGGNNTATGYQALLQNITGGSNTGLGFKAGRDATTGSYNVFLGADVTGMASDTNTMRLGLPYNNGAGQDQTFIAGIRGATVGGELVTIDANHRLGSSATAPVDSVGPPQVTFTYAASASKGGAAIDVDCAGCVSATDLGFTPAPSAPTRSQVRRRSAQATWICRRRRRRTAS